MIFTVNPALPLASVAPATDRLANLYDEYSSIIYGVLIRITGRDIYTADLLMEKVFCAINRNLDSLATTKRSCFVWVLGILSNTLKENGYYFDLTRHDKISFLRTS